MATTLQKNTLDALVCSSVAHDMLATQLRTLEEQEAVLQNMRTTTVHNLSRAERSIHDAREELERYKREEAEAGGALKTLTVAATSSLLRMITHGTEDATLGQLRALLKVKSAEASRFRSLEADATRCLTEIRHAIGQYRDTLKRLQEVSREMDAIHRVCEGFGVREEVLVTDISVLVERFEHGDRPNES